MIAYLRTLLAQWNNHEVAIPPPPTPAHSRDTEGKITEFERRFIEDSQGTCPDCETGKLLFGPRGGVCTNMLCPHCGAEFNLALFDGQLLFGERLPQRSLHLKTQVAS